MRIIVLTISILIMFRATALCEEELMLFTEEWKPISFSNKGRPDGLAVEIVREILRRVKMKDTMRIVPWARGWKMVTEHPNVVLFATTKTERREKLFAMIGPVAVGTTTFYARKGSSITIRSLSDAKQVKRIGVYKEAVEEQLLKKEGFTNLDTTSTPFLSAKKLIYGRIDLWCNVNLTAGSILKQAGYSINDVTALFTMGENRLYIAFSMGTPEPVIDRWQQALRAMKQDGTFAEIYTRWLPGETPPMNTERIGRLK